MIRTRKSGIAAIVLALSLAATAEARAEIFSQADILEMHAFFERNNIYVPALGGFIATDAQPARRIYIPRD